MGVEREEGLWWARYSGGEWVGLCVDCKSAIIGDVFFELDDPEIEWGPYLGKGPLGSMEGLVAWLVGQADGQASKTTLVGVHEALERLCVVPESPKLKAPPPGEFIFQTGDYGLDDSAGTPASPQGLKGTTQLDGGDVANGIRALFEGDALFGKVPRETDGGTDG